MEEEKRKTKYIVSISVDTDDIAALEMAKQLYGITTRSEMIRVAIRMIIDLKIKEIRIMDNDFDGIICPICGSGFSTISWDNRHTVPFGRYQGEDS